MKRFSIIAALAATLGFLAPMEAEAQSIDSALQLENEGLLVDALDAFEELLTTSGNTHPELLTILQHLSVLRFASGDSAGARNAIQRLLIIDGDATLLDSAPPALVEIHERINDRFAGRTLRADLHVGEQEGGEVSIRVRVINDVLDLVAGIELLHHGDVLDTTGGDGPSYRVFAPLNTVDEDLLVRLLDEYDSVLWEGRVEPDSNAGRTNDSSARRRSERPGWHSTVAWLLVGAGGLSIVVGGILVGIDESPTGEQRVVEGILEERVRTTAAGGWVLLGLGTAAAIGGLIWLLTGRRPARSDDDADSFALDLITRW